jgi:hypothetical protein
MRDERKFEIVVWVKKTAGFATLRDEVVDLARQEPFESTEYEGMVDFHWRFDTLHEAERAAEALSTLCDRPELVLLRLSNYDNLDASTTFKDARHVKH